MKLRIFVLVICAMLVMSLCGCNRGNTSIVSDELYGKVKSIGDRTISIEAGTVQVEMKGDVTGSSDVATVDSLRFSSSGVVVTLQISSEIEVLSDNGIETSLELIKPGDFVKLEIADRTVAMLTLLTNTTEFWNGINE